LLSFAYIFRVPSFEDSTVCSYLNEHGYRILVCKIVIENVDIFFGSLTRW
jgi:hypothetical protein